jgi:hypothetical protein
MSFATAIEAGKEGIGWLVFTSGTEPTGDRAGSGRGEVNVNLLQFAFTQDG